MSRTLRPGGFIIEVHVGLAHYAAACLLHILILFPYFQNKIGEGTPIANANTAKIVFPFPYPNAAYILGANKGNAKPNKERKQEVAANADAACNVNASMM